MIVTAFASFVAFAEKKPEARLIHLETLIEIILIKKPESSAHQYIEKPFDVEMDGRTSLLVLSFVNSSSFP